MKTKITQNMNEGGKEYEKVTKECTMNATKVFRKIDFTLSECYLHRRSCHRKRREAITPRYLLLHQSRTSWHRAHLCL